MSAGSSPRMTAAPAAVHSPGPVPAETAMENGSGAALHKGRFHRPELDMLRFGAFLMVFLHHALPQASGEYAPWGLQGPVASLAAAVARSGALGVDLFFALSSYLITELLLREHRVLGTVDVRSFYVRRVLRIWPLYYFALLVVMPVASWLLPGEGMSTGHFAGYLFLSGNWVSAAWGYPASAFALLWSVSIEEQFYLSWPWLVRRFGRQLGRFCVGMIGVAWITRAALAFFAIEHPGVWCNTLARLDPIAGGALLALWLNARPEGRDLEPNSIIARFGRPLLCISIGAAILIGAGAAGIHSGWGTVATYPLTAAACLLILYATLDAGNQVARSDTASRSPVGNGTGRVYRALCYLGKISFGLYVFHALVIRSVEYAFENQLAASLPATAVLPATGLVALAATIVCAAASYRFLESPFLRMKERFAHVGSRPV